MESAAAASGEMRPGWTEHLSPDGVTPYYYNADTGESTWERPLLLAEPSLPTQNNNNTSSLLGGDQYSKRASSLLTTSDSESKRVRIDSESDGNGVMDLLSAPTAAWSSSSSAYPAASSPDRRRAALDEKKNHLADFFSSRDSILDPNMGFMLAEWVNTLETLAGLNNSSTEFSLSSAALQASTRIADGYAGFGDQATLLGEWINLVSDYNDDEDALALSTQRLRELVSESKQAVRVLNDLLLKHHTNPPHWLLCLLQQREWRMFFIELASRNPSSPLLNFCVRYMVDSGHYEEIASSVTSTAAYFGVFAKTLGENLAQLIRMCEDHKEGASGAMLRIVHLAESSSPHVSFYCGQMLFDLERAVLGGSLLKNESTRYIMAHTRQRVQSLGTKLLHRGGLRENHSALAACLKRVCAGDKDACEACVEIHEYYKPPVAVVAIGEGEEEAFNPPPKWPLYERDFLDRLVGGLFRPSRKMDDAVRDKACWVLATAAFCKQGGDDANKTQEEEEVGTSKQSLIDALRECSRICNDPETIGLLESKWNSDTSLLHTYCEQHPTVSIGILFWARALLPHAEFQRSHAFSQGFLTICKMASSAAGKHPLQRPHAFAVLKRALDTRPPSDGGAYLSDARLAELMENVVESLVDLMTHGFVMPVLDHFIQHAPSLDLSLLRKFMLGTLHAVGEPYSKAFKEKFHQLLQSTPGMKAAIGGGESFQLLKTKFLSGQVKA